MKIVFDCETGENTDKASQEDNDKTDQKKSTGAMSNLYSAIQNSPCMCRALMNGIACGLVAGFLTYYRRPKVIAAGNWSIFTYVVVSAGTWHLCTYATINLAKKKKVIVESIRQSSIAKD